MPSDFKPQETITEIPWLSSFDICLGYHKSKYNSTLAGWLFRTFSGKQKTKVERELKQELQKLTDLQLKTISDYYRHLTPAEAAHAWNRVMERLYL